MSRGFRLAALAAVLYLAGVLAWIRSDRRSAQEVFSAGLVFNTGEDGLSLALAYLRERSGKADTLHRRVEPAGLPPNGVVLRIQRSRTFLLQQKEEEEEKDEKDGNDKKDKEDEGLGERIRREQREREKRLGGKGRRKKRKRSPHSSSDS